MEYFPISEGRKEKLYNIFRENIEVVTPSEESLENAIRETQKSRSRELPILLR